MSDYEQTIFISYAWGGEREEIVNQIDQALQARGVMIIRDKLNPTDQCLEAHWVEERVGFQSTFTN